MGLKHFLFWIPFFLSFSRLLVALYLPWSSPFYLVFFLFWAVLSDILDGWLARLFRVESRIGVYLDPLADKAFVLSFFFCLSKENSFSSFQLLALFSREISLLCFALFLFISARPWQVRSFILGKIMTSLQFLMFFLLIEGIHIATWFWMLLFLVGIGSFCELYWRAVCTHSDVGKKNLGERI